MSNGTYNENALLKSCLSGDTCAYEKIVEKYKSLVCAMTYSAAGRVNDSEELAQQVFVNAWSKLNQLKDPDKFQGWLISITRNVIRDSFKKRKIDIVGKAKPIDSLVEAESDTPEPVSILISKEREELVFESLQRIPEKYREPMVLFYRQQQSINEVARALDLTADTVKMRLSRGRKMLREHLAELVESTITQTSPKKAFTTAVIASVTAMALKGSGTASAGAAGTAEGASVSASSGLGAFLGTVTGKVVAAAAVVVIAVGAIFVYKNLKSPPAQNNKPRKVVDNSQADQADQNKNAGNAQTSNNGNISSSHSGANGSEPVKAAPGTVEANNSGEAGQVGTAPQSIDPDTLTDIHVTHLYHYPGDSSVEMEYRFKEVDYWHYARGGMITVSNGKEMLLVNKREKVAQLVSAAGTMPSFHDKLMFAVQRLGVDLLNGERLGKEYQVLVDAVGEIEYELVSEKSSKEVSVYHITIPREYRAMEMTVYVDSQTGLVKSVEVPSGPKNRFEFIVDYSNIALDTFSMNIPADCNELTDNMQPTCQGWIFDENAKAVANADIYLFGNNRCFAKGKSDSSGEFNFRIPVGFTGRPIEYPIFVRGVSKKHPDKVAWTVIQSPKSKKELPSFVPPPGEVKTETKDRECHAVHNVVLTLEPGFNLIGQILDTSNGKPVENATVSLGASYSGLFSEIAGNGERGSLEVKTDAEGFYIFQSVPCFVLPKDKENSKDKTSSLSKMNFGLFALKKGYCGENARFTLKSTDSLTDREFDMVLTPNDVTVSGRVIDQDGEPVVGYPIAYVRKDNSGRSSGGRRETTGANGEFKLTKCVYDKSLSVRIFGTRKPYMWDKEELTKGTEFVYCPDQTVPVPFEEGKKEYEIEVVLEKPKVTVLFEIKDTSGQPIEGMPVLLREDYRVINDEWAQSLWGVTGKDGKYLIKGLPETKELKVDIDPRKHSDKMFGGKPANDAEKELRNKVSRFVRFYRKIEKLPVDKKGYVIEVVMTRKGEKYDRKKQVKVFDSEGKEINSN